LKDRAKIANAQTTSNFAAAIGRFILRLERILKIFPEYASLPARQASINRQVAKAWRAGSDAYSGIL
jgi:hypothetical protein